MGPSEKLNRYFRCYGLLSCVDVERVGSPLGLDGGMLAAQIYARICNCLRHHRARRMLEPDHLPGTVFSEHSR